MKKRPYILFAAILAACSTKEAFDIYMPEDMGRVTFDIDVDNQVESTTTRTTIAGKYPIPEELIPEDDSIFFKVYQRTINEEDSVIYTLYSEYANVAEFNSSYLEIETNEETGAVDSCYTAPYLPAGDYTFTLSDGRDINEEGKTNAVFFGSADYTIIARKYNHRKYMVASLANSIIRLKVTDDFNRYFAGGATLKLESEAGTNFSCDFPFSSTGTDSILYVKPDTKLFLSGSAKKQDPGTGTVPVIKFKKSEIGIAKKGCLNTVIVDADKVGGSKIKVTVNETFTEIDAIENNLNDFE